MKKPPLLFLVHRIPYPPNKGDKIRSFNMMKELSEEFDIYLGCFIDDPEDLGFDDELLRYCKSINCIQQNGLICKLKGLSGFLTNKAITLPFYSSSSMQNWVDQVIHQHSIKKVLVFSSAMAQFVETKLSLMTESVIDFVDVDSDKWRQYAKEKSGVKAWFYGREARLLESYEKSMAEAFDHSSFVSDDEAALFQSMLPDVLKSSVHGIRNGVDTQFFDPKAGIESVDDIPEKSIVFTGAMDYWANVNAVLWFCEHVWPKVLAKHADAVFYVVGSKPSPEIMSLDAKNNIVVTGRVEDVRPYIAQTKLSIAPLQIARGIQNKVLEALAMAKPLVVSSMAAEGIGKSSSADYQVIDDAEQASMAISTLLDMAAIESSSNRDFVVEQFSWKSEMQKFSILLKGVTD